MTVLANTTEQGVFVSRALSRLEIYPVFDAKNAVLARRDGHAPRHEGTRLMTRAIRTVLSASCLKTQNPSITLT